MKRQAEAPPSYSAVEMGQSATTIPDDEIDDDIVLAQAEILELEELEKLEQQGKPQIKVLKKKKKQRTLYDPRDRRTNAERAKVNFKPLKYMCMAVCSLGFIAGIATAIVLLVTSKTHKFVPIGQTSDYAIVAQFSKVALISQFSYFSLVSQVSVCSVFSMISLCSFASMAAMVSFYSMISGVAVYFSCFTFHTIKANE
jgi:hypothetical protein